MPRTSKKSKKKSKGQKMFGKFIKDLEQLNKCRIKHCKKYGMGNESDKCVKKKCSRKLGKLNRKYSLRKKNRNKQL